MGLRDMVLADELRAPPAWLHLLLASSFFDECPEHQEASSSAKRSSGCNLFCATCTTGRSLCSECIDGGQHDGHKLIQVRKSSKHYVVKVKDMEALLGVGMVQPYHHNGDLVVFLNERPMEGKKKPGQYRCEICDRALLKKGYRFCSIGCKLKCYKEDDMDSDISFAPPKPKGDPDSSKNGTESGEEVLSRPTKRLRGSGSGSGNAEDSAAGTSTSTPSEPSADTPASDSSSPGSH